MVEHTGAPFANLDFNTLFKGGNIQNNAVVKSVTSRESLLQNVSPLQVPVPKAPRLEWHGLADTTVPYGPEKKYVHQQCNKGADIRFVSLPGQNHGEAFITASPGALIFLQDAFNGNISPASPCGSNVTVCILFPQLSKPYVFIADSHYFSYLATNA